MTFEDKDPDAIALEMEIALSSESIDVVRPWVVRGLGIIDKNNLKPTRAQVERGMVTPYKAKGEVDMLDWEIAAIWVARQDYHATEDELRNGLAHPEAYIRQAWVRRTDFIPSEAQITTGLNDEREYVRSAYLDRGDLIFNAHHIEMMIGFLESYNVMSFSTLSISVTQVFYTQHVMLTEDQINRVTESSYYKNTDDGPYIHDFVRSQIAMLTSQHSSSPAPSRKRVSI